MASKILSWFARKLNPQTPIILVLLGVALVTTCLMLAVTIRELSPQSLILIALIGLALGWLPAAAKPLPGWLAGLVLVAIGAELITVNVANLEPMLAKLARNSGVFVWQMWQWSPEQDLPNLTLITQSLADIWMALTILFERLATWVTSVITGSPTSDPVVSTLVWSLGVWLVSAWAGWITRRLNNPVLAILPAGVLLATVIAYHPKYAQYLVILVAATLLLMGVVRYTALENRWQANNIDYAPFKIELAFIIIPSTLFFIFLANLIPSVSFQKLAQSFRDVFDTPVSQAGDAMESLGLAAGSNTDRPTHFFGGLPQQHLLGSGPELGQQVALLIDTGAAPIPPMAVEFVPAPPRYYWRGLTYDKYTGRGWSTLSTSKIGYQAGEAVTSTADPNRKTLTQTVQVFNNQGNILYATGILVTANQPFSVRWRAPEDSFAATIDTTSYQVSSLVPNPAHPQELRLAGTGYPEYIRRRYLELPESVPDRVLGLARDLTAASPTPYDRALAIESYLRQYPYSLDLPTPPQGWDMVDYFLFNLQTGYCDYYASAMVVLARASGLPARIVVGYAGGAYNPVNARYVVTEADAHSWPEVYFPEYGWVEFEPTAAQPVPARPGDTAQTNALPAIPPELEIQPSPQATITTPYLWPILPAGMVLLAAAASLWWLSDFWRLRRLAPAAAVVALYDRLQYHGHRLTPVTQQAYTPYEFAELFTTRIGELARNKRWEKSVAPARQDIRQLTRLYVQTAYSAHPPTPDHKAEAIKSWQHLRWRLWLSQMIDLLAKLRKQPKKTNW